MLRSFAIALHLSSPVFPAQEVSRRTVYRTVGQETDVGLDPPVVPVAPTSSAGTFGETRVHRVRRP